MSIDDDVQRVLNDAKRDDLSARFGAKFSPSDPPLPPEIERVWLNHVEQFELLCRHAPVTTVRRFIGSPPVRPLEEVPPRELASELERLFELLRSNNIVVHFENPVSDSEAYRFIAEELLDKEIEDIRMDGLSLNFLYEEFHPDDTQDAMMSAEDFLFALFNRNEPMLFSLIRNTGISCSTGGECSSPALGSGITSFLGGMLAFLDWDTEALNCTLSGETATVEAQICWSGLETGTLARVHAEGRAHIQMHKSDGFWYITSAEIPGVNLRP
jgi:hypothetical protein